MIATQELIKEHFGENIIYSFGTLDAKDLEKEDKHEISVSFPLETDGKKVIKKVQKSCHCTSAVYNPDTNSVDAVVDVKKMPARNGGARESTIMVHIDTGRPEQEVDPKTKVAKPNPEYRSRIDLKITGVVR